jgi:hypothetical protein
MISLGLLSLSLSLSLKSTQMRAIPFVDAPMCIIPVDYCARTLVSLSFLKNGVFHLTHNNTSCTWKQIVKYAVLHVCDHCRQIKS